MERRKEESKDKRKTLRKQDEKKTQNQSSNCDHWLEKSPQEAGSAEPAKKLWVEALPYIGKRR